MRKIMEFIQSMFSPYGLKRFRYMTIFASVLIFILEAYILFLPINTSYKRNIDSFMNQNEFTNVFYNVKDEQNVTIDGIKNSAYYIKDYNLVTKDENEEIVKYKYTFNYNEELYYVYYVFDVNKTVDKEVEKITNKYKEMYPNDSATKKAYVSMLCYVKSLSGSDIDEMITLYHASSESDLELYLNQITYKQMYGIEDNDNTYMMLFYTEQYLIECPKNRITTNDRFIVSNNYENIKIDYLNIKDIKDFSNLFLKSISENLIDTQATMYLFNCLMYACLYTLLFAFFMYIFLHKKGCFRTFKEFYNVLAITSIVPCIIGFVCTWFLQASGGLIYTVVLTIYSTIFIYKANSISDMNGVELQ